jgi:hypothetical protein
MVTLGWCVAVKWVLVIACSMGRRMHSWLCFGLAMLVPCHVWGALLPHDEKTMFSRLSEWLHGALLARAAVDGADFSFHKKHSTLTNIQFAHKQEFMWGVHNTRLLTHNPSYS